MGKKGTHDEWDNELADSLERELGPDYEIRYPRMPNEADPKYTRWKAALKKEFAKLDDGAILVGHSIGGTILIGAVAEETPDLALHGIFLLAAPFVGKSGWPSITTCPKSQPISGGLSDGCSDVLSLLTGATLGRSPLGAVGECQQRLEQRCG